LEPKRLFNIPHSVADRQHGPFTDQRRLLITGFQILRRIAKIIAGRG
jgi:hypothetical protein